MIELLDHAIERVRAPDPEQQDDVAKTMLRSTGDGRGLYVMSPKEEASSAVTRAQSAWGGFATEKPLRAIRAQHGL